MTQKIVLASGNKNKIDELQRLLGNSGYTIVPQSDYDTPEAVEDGLSFVENAMIKARNACIHSGLPASADDSGLEVDALDGKPGIYSARFAGENATDALNNDKLLADLSQVASAQRTARFRCALVYMRHAQDTTPYICQGSWNGVILTDPQGDHGFGYDPLFFVPTHLCSSAQLNPEIKNKLSHRGIAIRQLCKLLNI